MVKKLVCLYKGTIWRRWITRGFSGLGQCPRSSVLTAFRNRNLFRIPCWLCLASKNSVASLTLINLTVIPPASY